MEENPYQTKERSKMSLIKKTIAEGTYTTEEMVEHTDAQADMIQRAQGNEDHYRNECGKKDVTIDNLKKQLKMSQFLNTLHTEKAFKEFAAICGNTVPRPQLNQVKAKMVAGHDRFKEHVRTYNEKKRQEEEEKVTKAQEKEQQAINRNKRLRPFNMVNYRDDDDDDDYV